MLEQARLYANVCFKSGAEFQVLGIEDKFLQATIRVLSGEPAVSISLSHGPRRFAVLWLLVARWVELWRRESGGFELPQALCRASLQRSAIALTEWGPCTYKSLTNRF